MAEITDARVNYGLSASVELEGINRIGGITAGVSSTQARLTGANAGFSGRAILATSGDALVVSLEDGDTTGTSSFTAGAAQVETATVIAASGITTSGNATVTVTAAGMTGSPKAVSVPLTTTDHTTATLIATAIAAALVADADVSALFTPTSSVANVILTRKPITTYTVKGVSYPVYAANDATLNIALADGTCVGITTASTSTDTTAGVATDGAILEGFNGDVEGMTIPTIATQRGILIQNEGPGDASVAGDGTDSFNVKAETFVLFGGSAALDVDNELTITASGRTDIRVTHFGATA